MFAFLVVAQMIAAQPPSPASVFKADDFPSYMLGKSAGVITRTTIDLSGRPLKCEVEVTSGEPKLDKHTCNIIMQRAKFGPARWVDGTPAMSVVRVPIMWTSDKRLTARPDIELEVDRLPPKLTSPVRLSLRVAVDDRGQIVSCDAGGFSLQKSKIARLS